MAEDANNPSRSLGMSLEDAVQLLNDRRHNGHSHWYIEGDIAGDRLVRGEDYYEAFTPFEAVAIAEKYASMTKRDSQMQAPPPK
jgi:hypothetical protein